MPTFEIENSFENTKVYGIDEAGLGPLAGPIVVASCFIKNHNLPEYLLTNIDDSKKLSRKTREQLFEKITNSQNFDYRIAIIENEIIDQVGLAAAWKNGILKSMDEVLGAICLLDGNRTVDIPGNNVYPVVKGDQKSYSIATASIIAKVTRDRIMMKIHEELPEYGFDKHVGYGTKKHLEALEKYAPCRYHRKSFAPVLRRC
ncbi:MAG: ribonuclease HII [Holosporales bacterium]|jgi:ribonuclease HII|nr:ribonuclease HII [Holosporales bacterium]